jgi:hypothetical protein
MSFHAVNPAGFSYLSSCPVESANKSLSTRNDGGDLPPSYRGPCRSKRTAIAANFRSQCADENFALERVCRYVSRLLLGHSFGAFPAPGGTRSSASHSAPLRGLGSSHNKFANHGKRRIVFDLEEKYNLSVSDDVARNFKTIRQVVEEIQNLLGQVSQPEAAAS